MKEVFASGINQMIEQSDFKQAEESPPPWHYKEFRFKPLHHPKMVFILFMSCIKTLKSSFSLLVLILKLKTTEEEKSKTRAIKNSNK